jgi:hypothetical protein
VTLYIDANGDAAIAVLDRILDRVRDVGQAAESNTRSVVSSLVARWRSAGAAISAAFDVAQKAWDLAGQAAAYDQSRQAFNNMVTGMGRDANREFAKIRAASAGLIDQQSLVDSANKAMALGIPVDNLSQLMDLARARAREMGTTTSQAFDEIVTSVGKSVSGLTTFDQRQAAVNGVIDAGRDSMQRHSMETLTAAEEMQKFNAEIKDLALSFGEYLLPEVLGITRAVNGFFDEFSDENKLNRAFLSVTEEIDRLQKKIKNLEEGTGALATFQGVYGKLQGRDWNGEQAERLKPEVERLKTDLQRIQDDYSLEEVKKLRELESELFEVDINTDKAWAASDAKVSNKHFDELAWMEEYIARLQELSNERESILNRHSKQGVQGPAAGASGDAGGTGKTDGSSVNAEELKRQEARIVDILQEASDRRELIGKEENEQALIRLQQRHRDEIAKMEDLDATKEALDVKRAVHNAEINQLLQEQSDEFYAEKDRLAAEDEAREEESARQREEREREQSRRRLELLEEENAIRRERFQRAASDQMGMVNSLEGEDLKKGLGMATAGLSGLQQAAEGQDPYSQELERMDSAYQEELASMTDMQQMKDKFAQWEEDRERILQQKKLQMVSNGFGAMAGMALAYYEMSGRKSKEAFALYKAFAIGKAIIDTYNTAQAGAASLAVIPFVGPALAAAWIATSIATGFMRVKQIAATQPGSAAAPTGGGGYSYNNPQAPRWTAENEAPEQERQPTKVTNYHIYGTVIGDLDEAGRALAPSVEKARTDGAAI